MLNAIAPFIDASVLLALGVACFYVPVKKIREDETGRERQMRTNRSEVGGGILIIFGLWKMGSAIVAYF